MPTIAEMFKALHARAHAFLLDIQHEWCTTSDNLAKDYGAYYDVHHRITINNAGYMPYVEAAAIGLTEGTLQPMDIEKFLRDHQVDEANIRLALPGLKAVNFRAQRMLEQKAREAGILTGPLPKKGDIFASKTDVNPIRRAEDAAGEDDVKPAKPTPPKEEGSGWL